MGQLDLLQIVITVIAAFAGSTVLSTVGFGIGMVGIPILLLALDPQTAVVVLNTVTTPLLVLIVWKNRHHVKFRETLPIAILGLLGALTGAYILSTTDDTILRVSIVVLIIALTIASVFDIKGKIPYPRVVGPTIGYVVGLLLGALGIGGPLLVLFILTRDWDRFAIRASMPLYLLFIMPSATVGYIASGLFTTERLMLSAIAIGPVVVGFWLGSMIAHRLNENLFRKAAMAIIIGTSIIVLVRELSQL